MHIILWHQVGAPQIQEFRAPGLNVSHGGKMKVRCSRSFSFPSLLYIIVFQSATPPGGSSRDKPPVERWLCMEREGQHTVHHPS